MFSAYYGQIVGKIGINNRKIEHIYHFSRHETAISFAGRYKRGNIIVGAFAENHAVYGVVNYVSQSTGNNQGYANDVSSRNVLAGNSAYIVYKKSHEYQPRNR